MRVLVADDEAEIRAIVGEHLRRQGIDVLEAVDGLETLVHVRRHNPDAIVLDLRMPRLGGLEALKRIREFNPHVVVVVITGFGDTDVKREALSLGARAVLSKPLDLPKLVATLRSEGPLATGADAERASGIVETDTPIRPADLVPLAPARVLVVDDEAEIREMLVDFLEMSGYDAEAAPDAESAIRALTEAPADIVLLDITMPTLSGVDALPQLRRVAPHAAVIMVSGGGDVEIARRALALGAFDYVMKPIDFDYLARSIETASAIRALEAGS